MGDRGLGGLGIGGKRGDRNSMKAEGKEERGLISFTSFGGLWDLVRKGILSYCVVCCSWIVEVACGCVDARCGF